jgi:hypothetical protein
MSTGKASLAVGVSRSAKGTLMALLFLLAETAETNSGGKTPSAFLPGFCDAAVCGVESVGASSHAHSHRIAAQAMLKLLKLGLLQPGIISLRRRY